MGFFRDAVAAGRESVEGPQRARAAELTAEMAAVAPAAAFAVALGAVYRNVFLVELGLAENERRPPAYLYLPTLPPGQEEGVRRYLRRDFEVASEESAASGLEALQNRMAAAADGDEAAVWISRACWLAFASAGSGLFDLERAYAWTEPFRAVARNVYDGWADFGHCFLAGERATPASNPIGRRSLRRSVEALLSTPGSPWRELPWPPADPPVPDQGPPPWAASP